MEDLNDIDHFSILFVDVSTLSDPTTWTCASTKESLNKLLALAILPYLFLDFPTGRIADYFALFMRFCLVIIPLQQIL